MANRFVPGCCCDDNEPCSTICVTVRECCFAPSSGATVTATKGATSRQCITGASGTCCIPTYPGEGGTWDLSVSKSGYTTVNTSVVVTECVAATKAVDLWTPPTTLTLTDPDGNEVTLTYDSGLGGWAGCLVYSFSGQTWDCDAGAVGAGNVPIRYTFFCNGVLHVLFPCCCNFFTGVKFPKRGESCPGPWSGAGYSTCGASFSGPLDSCLPLSWSVSDANPWGTSASATCNVGGDTGQAFLIYAYDHCAGALPCTLGFTVTE